MTWTEWQEHISSTDSLRDGQGPPSTKGETWKLSHLPFCVEQNTGRSSQCQRRIPTAWRRAKILTVAAIRNVSPHFCLLHLCIGSDQSKQNAVMHWAEWALPTWRRARARSALVMGVGPPWSAGPSRKAVHGNWLACIPLTPQWKELSAYPVQYGLLEAGAWSGPLMRMLNGNKRTFIEPATGKDIPSKVISLAQVVWALYLLGRKCSRPKAHSSVSEWKAKVCVWDCLFQHWDNADFTTHPYLP